MKDSTETYELKATSSYITPNVPDALTLQLQQPTSYNSPPGAVGLIQR